MRRIKKALVIFKEELKPHLSFSSQLNPSLRSRNSKLTEHEKTLLEVERVLKKNQVDHRIVSRGNLKNVEGFDLLITVGGDGTFLDTSHYASKKHLLLGVNSHPKLSHGAFCLAQRKNFSALLGKLLRGRAPLLSLQRLQLRIGKRRLPILALNEVLFANRSPAGTSRYVLKVGAKKEVQKSSGVWISTAAGSTAACRSAGGRRLLKNSKQMQFIVREPFISHPRRRLRVVKGLIPPRGSVRFLSQMTKAAVFVDGAHIQYDVDFGEEVEIRSAGDPVKAVLKS